MQRQLFLLIGGTILLASALTHYLGPWVTPIMLVVAYWVARLFSQPYRELSRVAERLREGDLQARASLPRTSPYAPLAATLHQLAEQLNETTNRFEAQVAERTAALNRKADQLRTVGQVGQQVAALRDPEGLLHFVVKLMRGAFGYDRVVIYQDDALKAEAIRGGRGQLPNPRSKLKVALRSAGRNLGWLVVQNQRPDAFDEEDQFTVETIAGQVSIALENIRLLEAERERSVTAERNRLAREIHDTLAQGFLGIIMQLRALKVAKDPTPHLEAAIALAQENLEEARRSVQNLRPRPLVANNLAAALRAEAQRRPHLQFELNLSPEPLPPALEAGLLRIAQEALNNIDKHADASRVQIELTPERLTIADDGVGFAPGGAAPGHFGLATMAERARLLGGELTIDSGPGRGCRVTVHLKEGQKDAN